MRAIRREGSGWVRAIAYNGWAARQQQNQARQVPFHTAAKRTELLAASSGARIAGLLLGCSVLQFVTALLTGFSAEAAVATRAVW